MIDPLPLDQQRNGQCQQAPVKQRGDKQERRKHHGIVPVINAAGNTAFVLHKPCLERTEKQNTDHVAHGIGQTDQQENTAVDKAREVQHADDAVEHDPRNGNRREGAPVVPGRGRRGGGLIIFRKLLLTSHALYAGGEETQHHLHGKNDPYEKVQSRMPGESVDRMLRNGAKTVQ